MTLGDIIKEYRLKTGCSMDEFARRCHVSKSYISILENNRNPSTNKPAIPSIKIIKAAADAMGEDFDSVFAKLDPKAKVDVTFPFTTLAMFDPRIASSTDEQEAIAEEIIEKIFNLNTSGATRIRDCGSYFQLLCLYTDESRETICRVDEAFGIIAKLAKTDQKTFDAVLQLLKRFLTSDDENSNSQDLR